MRHHADGAHRLAPPSTLDRAVSAWETGTKIYGLARGALAVGRAVAPYVAALL